MRLLAPRISTLFLGKQLISRQLHVPAVIKQDWLREHQKDVKILDASFTIKPKENHDLFLATNYGQFEKLIKERVNQDYVSSHIPGAVHFNLNVASYPGKFVWSKEGAHSVVSFRYARFGLYPPKIFEKYMQLLGLRNSDHLVIYGRGPAAGMLFAARAWWTLRAYGHQAVSVLNGGFDSWTKAGNPVSSDPVAPQKGSWIASGPLDASRMISFDELTSIENGNALLDKLETVNFLDTRVADQFSGKIPLEYPAKHATGSHIKGSKNVPINAVTGPNGLKSKSEILEALKSAGYDPSKTTYLSCNRAIQASLVNLAMEHVDLEGKVYNGSYEELSQRSSRFINAK